MLYNYLQENYFDSASIKNKISVDDTKQSLKNRSKFMAAQKIIQVFDDAVKTDSSIGIKNFTPTWFTYTPIHPCLTTRERESTAAYDMYISNYIHNILFFTVLRKKLIRSLVIGKDKIIFNWSMPEAGYAYEFPENLCEMIYNNTINNWYKVFIHGTPHNHRFIVSEIRENVLHINLRYYLYTNITSSCNIDISSEFEFAHCNLFNNIREQGISYDEWMDFLQNGQSFMKVYSAMFMRPELYTPVQKTLQDISNDLSVQPFIEEDGLSIPVKCSVSLFANDTWNQQNLYTHYKNLWGESDNPAIKGNDIWLFTITPDKILKNDAI